MFAGDRLCSDGFAFIVLYYTCVLVSFFSLYHSVFGTLRRVLKNNLIDHFL